MSQVFKVLIWNVEHLKSRKRQPYRLRWAVGSKRFSESFKTAAMADSFRSELKVALTRGEPFDSETGIPASMASKNAIERLDDAEISCFTLLCDYAEHKKNKSAKHRRGIADVLRDIMCILVARQPGRPDDAVLREAFRRFAFNPAQQQESTLEIRLALEWAEQVSPKISLFTDMREMRTILDGLSRRLDGRLAAPKYFTRRRRTFYNALNWAVVEEHLESNPLDSPKLKWERPSELKVNDVVDPREVGNVKQVESMLTAVSYVGRDQGRRFVAFFGCMYYAMARPEEVIELREESCELPDVSSEDQWGRLFLESAAPDVGRDWTYDGSAHDERGLKQRGGGEVRVVPIPPRLVQLLRDHLSRFPTAPDGRLFYGLRRDRDGRPFTRVSTSTYSKVWKLAREFALTPAARRTPLLRRPYSCRHSGVSKRRYAGVPANQVAAWAGHSVEVLERVYSKVLEGYDDRWRKQIDDFLAQEETRT